MVEWLIAGLGKETLERIQNYQNQNQNLNKNNANKNNTSNIDNPGTKIVNSPVQVEQTLFEYDPLKMYYRYPYKATDKIEIFQPDLGSIIDFGADKFYNVVSLLCSNTTSLRLQLWDMGIDWTKISDYELFYTLLIRRLSPKDTSLIFGDLNFSWFIPYEKLDENEEKSIILINIPRDEEGNKIYIDIDDAIIIDEFVYTKIVDYLRYMFDIHPKIEKNIKGKTTKQWIIEEERMNIEAEKVRNKGKDLKNRSFLFPLISSALNHPGFKYKKDELKEVGIFEFMDSVKRLGVYESSVALMHGMYSGMVDFKSNPKLKDELNWMRDVYK